MTGTKKSANFWNKGYIPPCYASGVVGGNFSLQEAVALQEDVVELPIR